MFFVADLIDLVGLDKLLDEREQAAGAIATACLIPDGLLRKAVNQTHRMYLKDLPKSTPGTSPENVQVWDPLWKPEQACASD